MSRTVLLSEVAEVAEQHTKLIAQTHARLASAGVPLGAASALQPFTDRLAADAAFSEQVQGALDAIFEAAPQMTQLEAFAVLVAAVTGPEHAIALADDPAADAPLRALFKFVLACRRRWRDAAAELQAPWAERVATPQVPAAATAPVFPAVAESQALPIAAPVNEVRPQVSAVPQQAAPARVLVTASAPGDSGMLGRALALAAEGAEPRSAPVVAAEDREQPARALRMEAEQVAARPARRRREPLRVAAPLPLAGVAELAEEEDEEPEQRPRRWGMGTAVMCGVLMGFAVGAFVHFDHKVAPASIGVTAPTTAAQANSGTKGRVKSEAELRAEIAALDSLANAPSPSSEADVSRPDPLPKRLAVRPNAVEKQQRRAYVPAHVPLPPAQDQQPATVVRSSGPGAAQSPSGAASGARASVAAAPGASIQTAMVAPGPLSVGSPGSSVFHTASTMRLPHVVTGSAGIMAANLVSSPAPAYPAAASAAGVQGEVIVEAVIGRGGEVVGTRVVSGPLLLRAAALDAVQRWHYRPYEVDGKPVEVATTARLEFRLDQ